jgi:predicted dehydrogenase
MAHRPRRTFLRQAATGVAAVTGMTTLSTAGEAGSPPVSSLSQERVAGANRRIRVGLIGCGGMGWGDLRDMLRVGNVECAALCDVDDDQVARIRRNVEDQFGQRPALLTRDFRRVLDDRQIDAVIVATPDHWHALPTVLACQAGKDVYVEKPLSLTIGEGRVMVDTARRTGRVVQMGTQQRSGSQFAEAVDYLRSGRLGKIRLVKTWAYQDWMGNIPVLPDEAVPSTIDYDLWLGPAPRRPFNRNRFHFNFRWYWDYSGGLMTDWGAHMIDIANWGMGVKAPRAAMSVGGKFGFPEDAEETPDTQQALWEFDGYSMIWEHATAIGRGPYDRDHGVAFHGNNGVLVVDRGGWEVYPESETVKRKRSYRMAGEPRRAPSGEDSHLAHVRNFLECVESRKHPRSDVEIGHYSMMACHLANIAFRVGRRVEWDLEREQIVNDPQAQALVTKAYRAPWSLPSGK